MYECINCGYRSSSWLGKCPECQEWDTLKKISHLEEEKQSYEPAKLIKLSTQDQKKTTEIKYLPTGIKEFDRVVGGGIVKGEVILFTGNPGIGKSTLLLQIASKTPSLYISAEETLSFVQKRLQRLKLNPENINFTEETQIEKIIKALEKLKNINLIIVDSIQTVYSQQVEAPPGSLLQIKTVLEKFIKIAKEKNIAIVLIGHQTKSGEYAGPKTLEHMVDCVLYLEGEKGLEHRILYTTKNRFGSTQEIGMFNMTDQGLIENFDPFVFLDQDNSPSIGKALTAERRGNRILLFEIQSLVVPTFLAMPRRVVKGVDQKRVLLLLAVIRKYLNLNLDKYDVYISITGGVKVEKQESDLAIIAAIYSSLKNQPIDPKKIFIGEVDLLGKIRLSPDIDFFKKNLKRLNLKEIISREKIRTIKDLTKVL